MRASRLDSGQSNPVAFVGLLDALQQQQHQVCTSRCSVTASPTMRPQWSRAALRKYLGTLTERAKAVFVAAGWAVNVGSVHCFHATHPKSEAAYTALRRAGVVVDHRHGGLRISFGVYNGLSDVELLAAALHDVTCGL